MIKRDCFIISFVRVISEIVKKMSDTIFKIFLRAKL